MKLRNDDDVHRYQRVFIDFRGWNIGEIVKARYVAWAVWALTATALYATIFARTAGPTAGALWSAAIAVGVTTLASPYLTNETGPHAWAQAALDEARAWRTARARTRRNQQPTRRWTYKGTP